LPTRRRRRSQPAHGASRAQAIVRERCPLAADFFSLSWGATLRQDRPTPPAHPRQRTRLPARSRARNRRCHMPCMRHRHARPRSLSPSQKALLLLVAGAPNSFGWLELEERVAVPNGPCMATSHSMSWSSRSRCRARWLSANVVCRPTASCAGLEAPGGSRPDPRRIRSRAPRPRRRDPICPIHPAHAHAEQRLYSAFLLPSPVIRPPPRPRGSCARPPRSVTWAAPGRVGSLCPTRQERWSLPPARPGVRRPPCPTARSDGPYLRTAPGRIGLLRLTARSNNSCLRPAPGGSAPLPDPQERRSLRSESTRTRPSPLPERQRGRSVRSDSTQTHRPPLPRPPGATVRASGRPQRRGPRPLQRRPLAPAGR
jgi:hypothetical protein